MADLEDVLTSDMVDFLDGLVDTGVYRDRASALRDVVRAVMERAERKKNAKYSRWRGPKAREEGSSGKPFISMKSPGGR